MAEERKEENLLNKGLSMKEVNKLLREYQLEKIGNDFFGRVSIIVIAAFSLIAALAWDSVLKTIAFKLFVNQSSLMQQFLYALILTALASIVSVYFKRRYKKD